MTTGQPELSVLVLGYNGRRHLVSCLGSVLDQELPGIPYEVIYADNGSSDGSVDLVRNRFPQVRVIAFPCNLGYTAGMNAASGEARGRYLVFLNQDTIMHRNALGALHHALLTEPGLGACATNTFAAPDDFSDLGMAQPPRTVRVADINRYGFTELKELPMQAEPIRTRFISGQCLMIDRLVVEELGYPFDPGFFMYAEDLDLCLRLDRLGYWCAVVPGAVLYHALRPPRAWGRPELRSAYRATRNRILAYFKTSTKKEFLFLLPRLIFGAPQKAFRKRASYSTQVLAFLVLIPVSVVSAVAAMIMMPRYAQERKRWVTMQPASAASDQVEKP